MAFRSNDELTAALKAAEAKLKEQDEVLASMQEEPVMVGTSLGIKDGRLTVATSQGVFAMPVARTFKAERGWDVALLVKGMRATGAAPPAISAGRLATVTRVVDDDSVEVEVGGQASLVAADVKKLNVRRADRVMVDRVGVVVVRNLGQPKAPKVSVDVVTWDDIGGCDDAKAALVEAIEMPAKYPDAYKRYGQRPSRGVLLYGPPGCGKTMLGRASHTALARAHGADPGTGFIYVKAPEILNMFVGNSEANVRSLFEQARRHKQEHGFPALIFIDEAEAIVGRRDRGVSSDVGRTIVPMFLAEMDGIEQSAATVILATNRPDVLDPAVVRDGRIDRKVQVPRPTATIAASVFKVHLADKPVEGTVDQLAAGAAADMFDVARVLYEVRLENGHRHPLRLADIASGAMIANVVREAAGRAMRREIASRKRDAIMAADLTAALDAALKDNMKIDHSDDVAAMAAAAGSRVVGVDRPRVSAAA